MSFPEAVYRDRQEKARLALAETKAECLLISQPENCRYLCGFSGENGFLFLDKDGAWLLTDFRFLESAREEIRLAQLVHLDRPWLTAAPAFVSRHGWKSLAVESSHLSYHSYRELERALDPVVLVPGLGLVERLRQVKDQAEIGLLRQAVQLTDRAFEHILQYIVPGVTEKDLALELDYFMGKNGSEGVSFPTIVATGARGARPHAVPGGVALREGDLLLMDFGAVWQGYHADLTRTVAVGRAGEREREIYSIVLEAQRRAMEAIRPGETCEGIDAVAREWIAAAGYGNNFGHRLGHSVGLAIHEEPSLGSGQERLLEPGLVLTVEPGIYIPGWGGVRIEDLILVTGNGIEVLSKAPREFSVVGR